MFSRLLLNHRGMILVFHRMMTATEEGVLFNASNLSISVSTTERIVRFFKSKGYAFVSLDESLEILRKKSNSSKFVVVTFDDGYLDNYTNAYPYFVSENIPVTYYLATAFLKGDLKLWWYDLEEIINDNDEIFQDGKKYLIGNTEAKRKTFSDLRMWLIDSRNGDALSKKISSLEQFRKKEKRVFNRLHMSGDQAREMSQNKLVTIGAHTVNHLALRKLSESDAFAEMAESKKVLEKIISKPVKHFAYPYGTPNECGRREFALAGQTGFVSAVTMNYGTLFTKNITCPHELPRIPLGNHTTNKKLENIHNGISQFSWNGFGKIPPQE